MAKTEVKQAGNAKETTHDIQPKAKKLAEQIDKMRDTIAFLANELESIRYSLLEFKVAKLKGTGYYCLDFYFEPIRPLAVEECCIKEDIRNLRLRAQRELLRMERDFNL